eukprot:g5785.t1
MEGLRGNSANSDRLDQLRECVSLLKEAVRKRKALQQQKQQEHTITDSTDFTIPSVASHDKDKQYVYAESDASSSEECIDSDDISVESEAATEDKSSGVGSEDASLETEATIVEKEAISEETSIAEESDATELPFNETSSSQDASTDEDSEISLKNQTLETEPDHIDNPPIEASVIEATSSIRSSTVFEK